MTERFQFARADGHPDWTVGNPDFDHVWDNAYDLLRFHKGQGFTITERPGSPGPQRKLTEVHDILEKQLSNSADDTVVAVLSLKDQFQLVFRRHEFSDPEAVQMIQVEKELVGTPYVFGFHDCSWLDMHAINLVVPSILLPHNATQQMHDSRVVHIPREKVKMGDILFHWGDSNGVDHVSTYLDNDGPGGNGRVIDTEPHDTGAPAGWPTGTLGTGVRIRPMTPGYYCDWAHVVAIGRIVAINGAP
jgi:hypothetical protein